ncbi:L-aspartate oxidase [Candidatus Magnetomonas plexicatena]|nr:L-aspartate oxidase [Nitrospirales bacterium LBB_01]
MVQERVDYLIIGSGVAGLRAAIELAPHGSVCVITKDIVSESCTEYAQGGVAVALSDEDTIGIHFEDTIKAGDGLCRDEAVMVLVEEGPERIVELMSWGMEFDKSGSKLEFTLEAAHSRRRVLHAHGDSTGKEIERVLINKARSFDSVKKYSFSYVLDLIVHDGVCYGAYIIKDNNIVAVLAKATILSTGGTGQIFSRTTNPAVATGDGIAMAFRAGAAIEDMEFVQFHPTTLYAPSAPQFLLTEALRGEGAFIKNIHKERFLGLYHTSAELAPRDVVSRAIVSELVRTNSQFVYLDATHLDKDYIKVRFPMIYTTCLKYDIDITSELVPISPAAHYMMGGVKTDTFGRTNIKRLFAAGEVAGTGVHGANRLASNSLLEGLVFGQRAGKTALNENVNYSLIKPADIKLSTETVTIEEPAELRSLLRKLMWEKAGIIRCNISLNEAVVILEKWGYILTSHYMTRYENEIKNMFQTSFLIVTAALYRKNSIGAHFRSDFPEKADTSSHHIALSKTQSNGIEITYKG